ncbi:MAG TPA: murein biosynthesis integral membrane protein MurJ [Acidimicrobiales bacterium]|nr:murein biosynthesis integral membrane protein MurJ [Acidimicrobiales bacterium]
MTNAEADAATAPPSGLARNTAVMAAGTVLSRATGFGRVLALAYALGASRLTDSYNVANTAPNLVYELVLGGVLSATLIPVFVEQLAGDDEDSAWRNVSALVTVAAVALAVVTLVIVAAAPLVIGVLTAHNDTASVGDQRAVGTFLLRLFAPQVLLLGAITFGTALLNVRRRFAAPTWSPILLNLWTIAVLVAFPHVARGVSLAAARHDRRGLVLLGLGTTLGYLVQFAAVIPSLRRAGVRLRLVWDPRNPAIRLTLRLAGWTVGVVAANLAAYLLIVVLAGGRATDYTIYTWAFAFFQLPHAIVAVSIMSALMPDLSERWARSDHAAFRRQLTTGIRATAAVLVPAAVGYALLAHPLVRVVLEHGRLSPAAARTTADTLTLFALGLPGFSVYLLLMRAFQAMKDTRTMFFIYAAENAATAVLALALYHRLGVQGLAVAFVAPYTVFAFVALARLHRATGGLDLGGLTQALGRIAAATAGMAVVVAGVLSLLDAELARAASAVVAGALVYVLLAKALKVEDLIALLRIRRRPT